MKYPTTISVFKSIGPSVHTRESSKILMKLIEQNQSDLIELDFSQVEFISRSFADQFYADKMNYAIKLKKNIIVCNANETVIHMLDAVAKTQNKKLNTFLNIPIYKYSSPSQLEDFLLSI